jgi:hypothetical protein
MLTRRALLAAGFVAPLVVPGQAFAALKMPRKEPPARVQPLGRWAMTTRKLEVVQDGTGAVTVDVPLQFRPAIDVETPIQRWWRISAQLPIPVTELPIELAMVSGIWTDVPITLTIPASTKKGGYRVSVEMVDPTTRRRASFSFLVTVLDKARS